MLRVWKSSHSVDDWKANASWPYKLVNLDSFKKDLGSSLDQDPDIRVQSLSSLANACHAMIRPWYAAQHVLLRTPCAYCCHPNG